MINISPMYHASDITAAQRIVTAQHYLKRPVDMRCSVEGYWISVYTEPPVIEFQDLRAGLFLLGRPEATRVNGWYGAVHDVETGKCEVTRWQILNLARVWLDPLYQPGGPYCNRDNLPGFSDRSGRWQSAAASAAVKLLIQQVGFDYLMRRPPVFLDEPYEIKYLISYCDTRRHKGTIYRAAGFELYRTNADGIQTWRVQIPPLTEIQHRQIRRASATNPRAERLRARRAQMTLEIA